MGNSPVTRRQLLIGAGAVGALGPLLSVRPVFADGAKALVRWDFVQFGKSDTTTEVLPGGSDVVLDSASGISVTLTGSGQAEPTKGGANGGGTFHVPAADGITMPISGIWFVTGFNEFILPGGSLAGVPHLADDIGEIGDTSGGTLSVTVRFVDTATGMHVTGTMTINCNLPGGDPTIVEGVTLSVPEVNFHGVQAGGATLFHVRG